MGLDESAVREKMSVALISVFAAVFITGFKLVIGLMTGSLGILSEALHSGLDLVAAVITFFSVRISDKPADGEHHYGHGKIENFSALIETLLLLVTCIWIIYEASHRLISGKTAIEINYWSYLVVIFSIIVDYSRSRALYRAARKHNSQALEADALHFSTDIWSSAVVFLGLVCANFGYFVADSIAALAVACIVIVVSYRLGKRSVNVLLDRTPPGVPELIERVMREIPGIVRYHNIKVRSAGADIFIEIDIHVDPALGMEQVHSLSHMVESRLQDTIDRSTIHVHAEPDAHK